MVRLPLPTPLNKRVLQCWQFSPCVKERGTNGTREPLAISFFYTTGHADTTGMVRVEFLWFTQRVKEGKILFYLDVVFHCVLHLTKSTLAGIAHSQTHSRTEQCFWSLLHLTYLKKKILLFFLLPLEHFVTHLFVERTPELHLSRFHIQHLLKSAASPHAWHQAAGEEWTKTEHRSSLTAQNCVIWSLRKILYVYAVDW